MSFPKTPSALERNDSTRAFDSTAIENLALRQQLAVFQRNVERPKFRRAIGVISHVDGLADRLGVRVHVEPRVAGRSSVKVERL